MKDKTWEFKKDEIFTKTDENGVTTMKIPPEVLQVNDWKEGDRVKYNYQAGTNGIDYTTEVFPLMETTFDDLE